jgi:hypothetical protein
MSRTRTDQQRNGAGQLNFIAAAVTNRVPRIF